MNEINLFDAISLCDYKKEIKNFFFEFLFMYKNNENYKIEFYLYKKKYILFRYFLKVNFKNEKIPVKLLLYFLKNLDEDGIELYLENFDNFIINDYYKDKLISLKSLKIKYQNFIKFNDYEGNLLNFLNDLMDYLYNNFSKAFPLFRIHGNKINDYGNMCVFNKKNLIKINIENDNNNIIINYNNNNYNNNINNNNNNNNYNNDNNNNYNNNNNNNNDYINNNNNKNNNNYNNYNNNKYDNNNYNNNDNNYYNNNNYFENNNKNLIDKSSLLLNKMNVQINDDQLFLNNNLIDDDIKNSFLLLDSYINNSNNNNLQNNNNNNNNINLEEKRKKEELETFNIIKNQIFNSIVDELTIKILNLDETKKILLNKLKENNNEFSNLLDKNNELNQQKNSIKNDITNLINNKNINLNNINSYLLFSKNVDKLIDYKAKIKTLNNYLESFKKLIINSKVPLEILIKEYRINSRYIFYLEYKYFSLYNSELKKSNINSL